MILVGNNLKLLATLADNSVDAIVTDPPYGLSFMGKKWDYDVPKVQLWKQCLRVLKPGGHLLAFAGTRTQHRMAVNIEDAGFEIRDMIAWVYGSGFPKSHNISKAIDKHLGAEREEVGPHLAPRAALNGTQSLGGGCPATPMLTSAGSPEAKQWEGWGTALKPSQEPLTWATKPLTTVPEIDSVIVETTNYIGGLLCLSLSDVKCVEKSFLSSLKEYGEVFASALWIVAVLNMANSAEESEKMDMFKSQEAGSMLLNIASLWLSFLEGHFQKKNMSITSTEIAQITALKTLNLFLSKTMPVSITRAASSLSGCCASVTSVEQSLSGNGALLSAILKHFATVNAILKTDAVKLFVSNAESGLLPTIHAVSSVLKDAITHQDESPKPAIEPITVARKPFRGTVAENVLEYGTGGLNVDGCRVPVGQESWGRVIFAKANDSIGAFKTEARFIIPSRLGRFPANLIHDGSDEVTGLFPETGKSRRSAGRNGQDRAGSTFGLARSQDQPRGHVDSGGSAARFFYCAKASPGERNAGLEAFDLVHHSEITGRKVGNAGTDNPRAGARSPRKNIHPTVKPIALMRYLVRLVTPPGGTILDPFVGSGTTGIAAGLEGFDFIGMELSEEYAEIAKARIEHWTHAPAHPEPAKVPKAPTKEGSQISLLDYIEGVA